MAALKEKTPGDSVTLTLRGESFTFPVRYTRDGGDRILPLVGDMLRAMHDLSIVEARRANGEKDDPGRPLSLSFMEANALGEYTRARDWIKKILNLN